MKNTKKYSSFSAAILLLVVLLACSTALTGLASAASAFSPQRFVEDARAQIGKTLFYDSSYTRIPYPGGDVPIVRGVCTDVVIRALRHQGIDLQRLVHEDMQKNFRLYPSASRWGLKKTDANIDHRRVPNLQRYFERQGYVVTDKTYLPGDIVTWNLHAQVTHIGIVSDRMALLGKRPLIIHNIGYGAREEDILYEFTITGHYRIAATKKHF
ncbi:MAG: DUF1287 domain-containing protein [Desulfobulbaceae bacterium]|jgi:uncharacterized protein YijF (DUF1287 family)|nr:DUF1287 domain-containing protein [Desulfobulbaceae bacterium]